MLFDPPNVKLYKALRKEGRAMSGEVTQACCAKLDIAQAAKRMGLGVLGKTLMFDDESDMTALTDFIWHENYSGLGAALHLLDESTLDLSAIQKDLLAAHRKSYTSLFETHAVVQATSQVLLHDVLVPTRSEIQLTDLGFSQTLTSLRSKLLIFLRIVEMQGVFMSSGFFFAFNPDLRHHLEQTYLRKTKRLPERDRDWQRFAIFFERHRKCGIEVRDGAFTKYQDV